MRIGTSKKRQQARDDFKKETLRMYKLGLLSPGTALTVVMELGISLADAKVMIPPFQLPI